MLSAEVWYVTLINNFMDYIGDYKGKLIQAIKPPVTEVRTQRNNSCNFQIKISISGYSDFGIHSRTTVTLIVNP